MARKNGRIHLTDGPFTEAKEVVGGFAILRANSKEEAIQLARDFRQVAGEGECELRDGRRASTHRTHRRSLEADMCAQNTATSWYRIAS
jgi:hypothetical protein